MTNCFKIPKTGKITVFLILLFSSGITPGLSAQQPDIFKGSPLTISDGLNNSDSKPASRNNFYRTDSIFSFHSRLGYLPSLLHNFRAQATAPFHFKTKQWLLTGSAIGITSLFFAFDDPVEDWARPLRDNYRWIRISSPIITEFGNHYGLGLVCAIGGMSAAFNKEKGVQTSLLATQAMITSGVWCQLIKTLTGRERPKASYIYSHYETGKWYGPFSIFDRKSGETKSKFAYDAFPSGHTAIAFSIATVFATQYNEIKFVPVLCYSTASLVGVTRLIEHEHWASDVFAGAVIGYLCGKQVVRHFNEIHPEHYNHAYAGNIKKPEFTFTQNGNQVGFAMKW